VTACAASAAGGAGRVTWREEAHQQHRLKRVAVQALADARAAEQLARRHGVVAAPGGRAAVEVGRGRDQRQRAQPIRQRQAQEAAVRKVAQRRRQPRLVLRSGRASASARRGAGRPRGAAGRP